MTASRATKVPNARISILARATHVLKRLNAPSSLTVMNSSVSVLLDSQVSPEIGTSQSTFLFNGFSFQGVSVKKPLIIAKWVRVTTTDNVAAKTALIIANAQMDSTVRCSTTFILFIFPVSITILYFFPRR